MPNTKSSAKRLRQDRLRTLRNRRYKNAMKQRQKSFIEEVDRGETETAREKLKACFSILDKAAKKGAIHKNEAARRKARLNARFDKMSV